MHLTLRPFLWINLRKNKWLICCGYNPSKSSIKTFTQTLDSYMGNYNNFLVVGNLNSEMQYMSSLVFIISIIYAKKLVSTKSRESIHIVLKFTGILKNLIINISLKSPNWSWVNKDYSHKHWILIWETKITSLLLVI